jgi:hypothetical protein
VIVPTVEFPPATPLTDHEVTLKLVVNSWMLPAVTTADEGRITAGNVTFAEAPPPQLERSAVPNETARIIPRMPKREIALNIGLTKFIGLPSEIWKYEFLPIPPLAGIRVVPIDPTSHLPRERHK